MSLALQSIEFAGATGGGKSMMRRSWISAAVAVLVGLSALVPAQGADAPSPPGYTLGRTGGAHDFDYFEGAWTTTQRRLKTRGVGSTEWEEFPATLCMALHLEGIATVDEIWFPTKKWAGLTLRAFDLEKRQWSVYWISSERGKLESPVLGGFAGPRGEFYGEDQDDGRPVKVRYTWQKVDNDHAHWEQAFSYDNRSWETNWTAEFVRADAAKACKRGLNAPLRAS
jgi:hypothetical protein